MKASRAIAVVHDVGDVAGCLPPLFAEQGIDLELRCVDAGLPDPASLELLLVLGSPESAYDHRVPWLAGELAWLKAVQLRGVPTLGICFGSQLLARALGGEVYRNREAEIGWTTLDTPHADWSLKGPWLNFHFDAFTPPPGSTLLGSTDLAAQAYRHGRSLGVQFHPEIDTAMFDTWIAYWQRSEEGRRFMAEAGDLPERIRAQIAERERANQDNCRVLLKDFLERS
ncbi:type 1 glutamine amidotransferase [Pseudomonas sp. ZM23]|uniref:Type 1 glutamine amidotransferase n=1 Tax=Pseudomonas triclosanedens TaxID=2961893 RepID=A0ABY7A692_9PSED|nr:type 1 glutamine amidotransferase [Pseudomonas triclosanedens]MCP8464950.1 type 1 glutamine amidotransferase [Pseudomonas triclosanedens]MCP8470338.1 type 1 glutamine amidotransferase [Pseudomonas triclosanedens]MCP8476143.1 type 1 glutamine amidotransferase [Pseudomonas triclosanedens]WAI51624.1 type 1 glutamine amidotransferase [Pseudomonas triclosanedens]